MPTPAYVTVPNPATGDVIPAAHVDDIATDLSYLKDRVDNPPRAFVYHNATQSIADATDTAVAFNSEFVDPAALHDTATNNSRITIPTGEGGFWLFTARVEFAASAAGQRKIYFRKGGSTELAGLLLDAAAGSQVTKLALSFYVDMAAGTYMEVIVSQNSGGALNLSASPYFTAQRIA